MTSVEQFESDIFSCGVIDPEGYHHEFASGAHGQKIDFGTIPAWMYRNWVDLNVRTAIEIQQETGTDFGFVVGVADGTNQLAEDVGLRLGAIGLKTQKTDDGGFRLGDHARYTAESSEGVISRDALVLEDVGTTGETALRVAKLAIKSRLIPKILITLQRKEQLSALTGSEVPFRSIIVHLMKTYTPEECRESGFCADDWELIERSK